MTPSISPTAPPPVQADGTGPRHPDRAPRCREPQRHEKTFEARRDQVHRARRFLAGILDGCPAADDVLLAASELAANSVLHSTSSQPGGTFTLTAQIHDGEHVRIEVRDHGGPWNRQAHRDDRPHGLDIIAALAASHGVNGDPLTGWTAWAVLPWQPATPPPLNGHADR